MKTKAQIEYQIWKRHRLDRRYHWLHKYKCAKGCEICKWKPSERYIKLHNGISMGYTFVFDNIYQETKHLSSVGRLGRKGMSAFTERIVKDKELNSQHRRTLFIEIRKCRILCHNCHFLVTQDQTKTSQAMYKKRTGLPGMRGRGKNKVRTLVKQTNLNNFFN